MGAVHVPVSGVTYLGKKGSGAWMVDQDDITKEIQARKMENSPSSIKVLTSRSHSNDSLDNLVKDISKEIGDTEVVTRELPKNILLAEGKADLYPRQTPTCEWDTAAAHAVLADQVRKSSTTFGYSNTIRNRAFLIPIFLQSLIRILIGVLL